MIGVTVLGSGSRGNAILVDGMEGSLLIDAGFGSRALAQRLAIASRRPEDVHALLLTHEHSDHASGATAACKRWSWPVLAVPETLAALTTQPTGCPTVSMPLAFDRPTMMSGFSVTCAKVPHDAEACAAFVITDIASGTRVGIAMDLGHVTTSVTTLLGRCDLLVVESNHDERMLADGPYPWMLKRRVGGDLGHLSNGAAAALIGSLAHRGLRGVILTHLSQTNNTPELALARTRATLRNRGWQRDTLWAASQSVPGLPVAADGSTHRTRAAQLTLQF